MDPRKLMPLLGGKREDADPEHDRTDLDDLGRAPREEWFEGRAVTRWRRIKRRAMKTNQRKGQLVHNRASWKREFDLETAAAMDRVLRGEAGTPAMQANVRRHADRVKKMQEESKK